MARICLLLLLAFCGRLTAQLPGGQSYFEPQQGQWPEMPVLARAIMPASSWFITEQGFRIKLFDSSDVPNIHKAHHRTGEEFTIKGHNLELLYKNALKPSGIEYLQPMSFYFNYFLGNDPALWRSRVYPCREVLLKNIYPGIDSRCYFNENDQPEQDFIVNPNGNVSDIQVEIKGSYGVTTINGEVWVSTSVGDAVLKKPEAWQWKAGKKVPVSCFFVLSENLLSISATEYDRSLPLIVDPILVFSTYSGSRGDNFGYTATFDDSGHLYAGGIVDTTSGQYPVTLGAFMVRAGGMGPASAPVFLGCDATISKYASDGKKLLFATYLGGKSNESPHSLVVNNDNQLLVFGTTSSHNFPVVSKTAFSTTNKGGFDLYISRFSEDGTQLLASTYIGGTSNDGINDGSLRANYADDFRGDIYTDINNNVYVASCSKSNNFPVSPFAYQTALKGGIDGVVFSMDNDLKVMRFCTYVGGSEDDASYSAKLDIDDNLFVSGGTASSDFPISSKGYAPAYIGGAADGFVLKMTSDSGKLINSTFYGTTDYDQAYFLDLDIDQKVYLTGQTKGKVKRSSNTYGKDNTSQFIGCLHNNLDSLFFQTTFGNRTTGIPELVPSAFMVDNCYNIYFSGWGSDLGFGFRGTTNNLPITSDAYQKTTDGNDFYLIAMSKYAQTLVYATYFGGDQSEDHVDGGTSRFDKRGVVYQSVCASCPNNPPGLNDFPTTSWSVFPANVSIRCSNASFKLDFNITYATQANFKYSPHKTCLPANVTFTNLSKNGLVFKWEFGDGDTSSARNPVHAYKKPGKYTVVLTSVDPASCNKTDIRKAVVEVLTGPEGQVTRTLDFCKSLATFELKGNDFDQVFWDLGDGSTETDKNKVEHQYNSGNYTVRTYLTNTQTGCKDTVTTPVNVGAPGSSLLSIANVFTPDGDGKNDCFSVYGLSADCAEAHLRIYNRWGVQVYESTDMAGCWNGRVENVGAKLPEATYYYLMKVKYKDGLHKDVQFKGAIQLIR